jgi:hypothetical protein
MVLSEPSLMRMLTAIGRQTSDVEDPIIFAVAVSSAAAWRQT